MRTLWTTRTLCAAVSDRYGLSNNNQLANKLGVRPSTTLDYSRGAIMADSMVPIFAQLLDEDDAWIALCLAIERVKSAKLADEMRAILLAAANRAAVVALGLGVVFGSVVGHFCIT